MMFLRQSAATTGIFVASLVAIAAAQDTPSPTQSPTASPTRQCSELYQVFHVTETAIGEACFHRGKSMGGTSNMGCGRTVSEVDVLAEQVALGFAARAQYTDGSLVFALPGEDDDNLLPFDRMLLEADSESDGAWTTGANLPSVRNHEVCNNCHPILSSPHLNHAPHIAHRQCWTSLRTDSSRFRLCTSVA